MTMYLMVRWFEYSQSLKMDLILWNATKLKGWHHQHWEMNIAGRCAAPDALAHRHGVSGIQPGRAPDRDGKPADRRTGQNPGLESLAAQV